MKIYKGKRIGEGELNTGSDVIVTVRQDWGKYEVSLKHRVYHSPTGFSWGYCGSGPADLSRSILWDMLGKEPPRPLYMRFKDMIVSGWKDVWEITSKEIIEWIEKEYNKDYCNYLMRTEITEKKFNAYLAVQKSGITNMFDINNVIGLSARMTDVTLTKEEILEIMKNYKEYKEKYK